MRVSGFDPRELRAFTAPLLSSGVIEDVSGGSVMLVGKPKREVSVVTGAYPGFATDLQPIFATILAAFQLTMFFLLKPRLKTSFCLFYAMILFSYTCLFLVICIICLIFEFAISG